MICKLVPFSSERGILESNIYVLVIYLGAVDHELRRYLISGYELFKVVETSEIPIFQFKLILIFTNLNSPRYFLCYYR